MNHTTTNDSDFSFKTAATIGCAFGSLVLVTNVAVVFILCSVKALNKNPHVFFVLSLSISDSMLSIALIMFLATAMQEHKVSVWFCTFQYIFLYTSLLASCGQVLIICTERFLATTYRSTSATLSRRKKKILIAMNCCVSCFLVTIVFISIPKDNEIKSCFYSELFSQNFTSFSLTVGFLFAAVITIIMGCHIATVVRISTSIPKLLRSNRRVEVAPENVPNVIVFQRNLGNVEIPAKNTENVLSSNECDEETLDTFIATTEHKQNAVNCKLIDDQALISENACGFERKFQNHHRLSTISKSQTSSKLDHRKLFRQPTALGNLRNESNDTPNQVQYIAQRKRAFITVTIILITFIVCFIPSTILYFIRPFHYVPISVDTFTYVLLHLHCVTNPVLYAWRLPDFRKQFLRLCKC